MNWLSWELNNSDSRGWVTGPTAAFEARIQKIKKDEEYDRVCLQVVVEDTGSRMPGEVIAVCMGVAQKNADERARLVAAAPLMQKLIEKIAYATGDRYQKEAEVILRRIKEGGA